ncbi:YecR family lipoprotein [Pseudomonas lactis]
MKDLLDNEIRHRRHRTTALCRLRNAEILGGHRQHNPSDGLVQLSYVRTPFEYAQIRESQGLAIATGRCQFWDYARAERAGAQKSVCRTMGQFHCLETTVTQDYRCQN